MSTFTDALLAFISAREVYVLTVHASDANGSEIHDTAQRLAQAGDVVEGELRSMIRAEVEASDFIGWVDPTTCSHHVTRSGGLGKPDICERCGDEL